MHRPPCHSGESEAVRIEVTQGTGKRERETEREGEEREAGGEEGGRRRHTFIFCYTPGHIIQRISHEPAPTRMRLPSPRRHVTAWRIHI